MKLKLCFSVFLLTVMFSDIYGQNINADIANSIALKFINEKANNYFISEPQNLSIGDETLAYQFDLIPDGFVIISANENTRPVLAYSFHNIFESGNQNSKPAVFYLKRLIRVYNQIETVSETISDEWDYYLSKNQNIKTFEQWPPQGSTTTGGWLEENWSQGSPYNVMCPMDLNTGNRSIAGCPAVAMASIIHFNKQTLNVQFSDDDDYYHSYGAGNQYWIDDDHQDRDFPSFPELNTYILSLQDKYNRGETPTQDEVAALNFASGVACKQVYSSSISGTFGIDQAFDAYVRFGFDSVRLIYDTDTTLNQQLADNMKSALPAHIGLVDPGHTVGHNLIVDGYNTDEYYHFNFGWGGSSNGWYTMPPTNIPYNLTVIEGLILDINKEGIYVDLLENSKGILSFTVSPNPVEDVIYFKSGSFSAGDELKIFSHCGQLFDKIMVTKNCTEIKYDFNSYPGGIYLVEYQSGINRIVTKVMKP